MHNVVPGAKAYIATFQIALARKQATLLCNASVEAMLCEGKQIV